MYDGIGAPRLELTFRGELIEWRGPAPFHFVRLPPEAADAIKAIAPLLTYGWGAIPVRARIGGERFTTALFPRQGGYLLPVKDAVRTAVGLALGDEVPVELEAGG